MQPAPAAVAGQLALGRGAGAVEILGRHWAGDRPYQLEHRWINLAAVPEARDESFSEQGPGEWLLQAKPLSDAEHVLTARNALPREAGQLQMVPGDALFVIERLTLWQGEPSTWVRRSHPPQPSRLATRDLR